MVHINMVLWGSKDHLNIRLQDHLGKWHGLEGGHIHLILKIFQQQLIQGNTPVSFSSNIRSMRTQIYVVSLFDKLWCSLLRLSTDYIDLYQIHWPDRLVCFSSLWHKFNVWHFFITLFQIILFERYVPMFGETEYDPNKQYSCVPMEEQLDALQKAIDSGKVWCTKYIFFYGFGVFISETALQVTFPYLKAVDISKMLWFLTDASYFVDMIARSDMLALVMKHHMGLWSSFNFLGIHTSAEKY
jgi:Aldo/keto reductase family